MGIRFEDVTFQYPGSGGAGVFDIGFEVEEGELLAIIGPSGSGKSTLLKLLTGFLQPDRGRIVVDGEDLVGVPSHKRNLGVVFQTYALFQHMNARDNVAYPLKVRGMAKAERGARADEALARVGLGAFADRLPQTLSGGQQQRVALARALVYSPRALLLDEPLSALDASLRAEMRDEVRRVQRDAGISALHVTHDQEEALSIADRVAVMFDGRLLQIDRPSDLYDRPVNRTVAAFVGQANLWEGRVAGDGRVDTAIGALHCDTAGFGPGDAVTVLVRPEYVLCGDALDGRPNSFAGRLATDRFLGPIRRYDFAVGNGVVRGETSLRGAIGRVAIPPERIRLLSSTPDTHPDTHQGDMA